MHQWRAAHPPIQGFDRLGDIGAVQGLIEIVDDGLEDATPLDWIEHRLRPRREVGPDPMLEVEGELRIGEQVGVPIPSRRLRSEIDLALDTVNQISIRRCRPLLAPVVVMSIVLSLADDAGVIASARSLRLSMVCPSSRTATSLGRLLGRYDRTEQQSSVDHEVRAVR